MSVSASLCRGGTWQRLALLIWLLLLTPCLAEDEFCGRPECCSDCAPGCCTDGVCGAAGPAGCPDNAGVSGRCQATVTELPTSPPRPPDLAIALQCLALSPESAASFSPSWPGRERLRLLEPPPVPPPR